MAGFMSIFVPRMLELKLSIITAVNLMTCVSIAGILLSILWGYIDDKIGTPRTATILGCMFILANICMLLAGFTGQKLFIYLSVFLEMCIRDSVEIGNSEPDRVFQFMVYVNTIFNRFFIGRFLKATLEHDLRLIEPIGIKWHIFFSLLTQNNPFPYDFLIHTLL